MMLPLSEGGRRRQRRELHRPRGVPTLDGLGAVGGGAHADHEYVEVETMPGRADLLAAIIEARTS